MTITMFLPVTVMILIDISESVYYELDVEKVSAWGQHKWGMGGAGVALWLTVVERRIREWMGGRVLLETHAFL